MSGPLPTPDPVESADAAEPDVAPPAVPAEPAAPSEPLAEPGAPAPADRPADRSAGAALPTEPDGPASEPGGPASRRHGTVALALAIPALAASLVVGWVFPLGLAALGYGVAAARTPQQRTAGVWAIALAAASLLYSAGWLVYAAAQAGWIP